jgi:tetratricopeptide (TPR) repeat protein
MIRTIRPAGALGLALAAATLACSSKPESTAPKAPLYTNLGSYHHPITTKSPEAQKYFDQGLALSYAFNHAEAIRSFRQGIALDPDCAMCYWGVAFAYGPNINAPITEEAAKEAYQAIQQALELAPSVTGNERGYIQALARRYDADPKAERAGLDSDYSQAMSELVEKFPDDLDAVTLFAQSLMDTSPWNYYEKDGRPRLMTTAVIDALESVLKRRPDHAGAIHFYIHAVEASPDPARAEAHADRLAALMPGAGHIVHMPGHIYLRTGRYADASRANVLAMKADEAYFAGDAVAGNMMYQAAYYPHNIHFLVASTSLEGRRDDALKAADELKAKAHADMLRDPAMGAMIQHMHLAPIFTKVRFSLWDQVLAEPVPAADLHYMAAMSHVARGLALAAQGKIEQADAELAATAPFKDEEALTKMPISSTNFAGAVVGVGYEVLAAEIAARRRNAAEASRHYAQAVALEDALTYTEPPDWPIPVRQLQGEAMLALGRAKDAETAFRDDMKKFPDNGWSLSGLQKSLERQKRTKEAAEVKARLDKAWAGGRR